MSAGSLKIWFAILLITGCPSCATSSDRDRPPPQKQQLLQAFEAPVRTTPPEFIPDAARAMLRARMALHAKDMLELMSAVVGVRYVEAEALAGEMVDDASPVAPIGSDADELNKLLPAQFFVLQDQFRDDARAVAAGAHRLNAMDLGEAYGRLSQGCVACHALFRPSADRPLH